MNSNEFYLLILIVAFLTYMTRRLLLRVRFEFSKKIQCGINTIPLGIFAAIIFPSIFISDSYQLSINPILLIGCVCCLVIMWRTSNVLLSIVSSMLIVILVDVFWVWN